MFEYQAFIPGDPHDSWSQDHHTGWLSEAALTAHLEQLAKLPGGNEGVKVYKREVGRPVEATEFRIP